jgi:hypothetical protein
VADDLQPIGVLVRDDGERGVALDAVARVDNLAVDLAGQRRLGQAGADGGGHLGHRGGLRKLASRAVGQRDVDAHVRVLWNAKSAVVSRAFVRRKVEA